MNKTRTSTEDKSKEELIAQVQSLRDQLFAISMANVNDGSGSDEVYESYNNIILDEISALRDEIAIIKQSDETNALSEELAQIKDKLTNLAVDDREQTEARFREIRSEIAQLRERDTAKDNQAVLEELAQLKEELKNARAADAATADFMSELARVIEQRNNAAVAATDDGLREELADLKAEIASSLSAPATATEELRDEIEELRAQIGNSSSASVAIDNSAVLEEIAALREEFATRESAANNRILQEIVRLKEGLGALQEKDTDDDGALSRSINDLKAELNQLAGFVEEEAVPKAAPKPKKAPQKKAPTEQASGKRRGRPKGSKNKTSSKRSPSAKANTATTDDGLISRIDAESREIGKSIDSDFVLDPNFVPDEIPPTQAEMDLAERIAKQVANKLIMEQLVEQLGDADVTSREVDEIVREIMPQEFTTVAIDAQTDKVRRLANSLVLDKLRNRLKK